jgi:tripartite ATP-independent transporter DctP family solute receptor
MLMKSKQIGSCTLWLISTFFIFISCNRPSSQRILRLPHGLDQSHSVHQALEFLGARLAEKSDSQLIVKIYPNQQLGTERECLELLQIGSVDITKASAAVLENFVAEYKVLSLPYLFRDKQHQFNVLDGPVGDDLLNAGERYWLYGLGFYDSGSRSFYTKDKPVLVPEDLQGLNIRTQESPTAMAMVDMLGGSATPLSFGELYTALQAGVVDGAENNPPSFYLTRHYEVCKYYSIDEHTSIPDVLLISTMTWNSLNEQQQEWLQQAVFASERYQRELWQEAERYALEQVKKAGVKIFYPDKRPFMKSVQSMYAAYETDPVISQYITRIRATK